MGTYAPREHALLGVSARFKSIVKHRIGGLRKRVSCAKKLVDRFYVFLNLRDKKS